MLTILKWPNINKLSLNVAKTKIFIFDNANFSVENKLLVITMLLKSASPLNILD